MLEHLAQLTPLERRESRLAWRDWTKAFCRGGRAGWDAVGGERAQWGSQATYHYQALPGSKLLFGSPDGGFCSGTCTQLPPYSAWEEYFRNARDDDALYIWDAGLRWTLVLHHEQFAGLVEGPILECHHELPQAPWIDG